MSLEHRVRFQTLTPERTRSSLVRVRESYPVAFTLGMNTVAYKNGVEGNHNLTELPQPDEVKQKYVTSGAVVGAIAGIKNQVSGLMEDEQAVYDKVVELGTRLYPDTRAPLKLSQRIIESTYEGV